MLRGVAELAFYKLPAVMGEITHDYYLFIAEFVNGCDTCFKKYYKAEHLNLCHHYVSSAHKT